MNKCFRGEGSKISEIQKEQEGESEDSSKQKSTKKGNNEDRIVTKNKRINQRHFHKAEKFRKKKIGAGGEIMEKKEQSVFFFF